MLAREVETLAAIGYRTNQNGLLRPEVVAGIGLRKFLPVVAVNWYEVEDRRGEVADRAALLNRYVPCHRQGLQIHLRSHDGTAEVQQHTSFQPLDRAGEDQEIPITRRTDGSAVAVGMFVNDVVPDSGMYRDRHAQSIRRGKDRETAMRIVALLDPATDVLAETQTLRRGLANPFVQFAGFLPEAKLAGANVAVDALRGRADPRQLVVVDRACAVHRDVVDVAALHQVDQVPVDARAKDVRPHQQNTGCAAIARR